MGSNILLIGQYAFEIYYWLILISIFSSWFPQFQATKIGIWIAKLVEPYLGLFRRFIPPLGPIDFSPIIALFAFRFIRQFALEGLRQSLNVIGA
ncbi:MULTISPECIES: YggT family protein [Bacillaceae]|uniref:YggT family protein n=1 Tax=Priestia megaterium TaxID=1404 RepID=A0A6H1NZV4_PRIMG|nr:MULTISPECIES: YggT family protein [Bacillaceae]MBT2697515.1 YggT family protein [Bacillus sp. ISL-40]MBT2720935.1 YggT family protein [Bacillus sp. ISL-46]MBT2742220.1 YggT family protein [Bacillus sp. ISL-77]QIZ06591.1 YggT family protein [Priestia megaterium]SMQ64704.1 YggT family protein [Bacillus sp. OV166]